MLQRRDWVMRMVRQLGDAIARVLKLRKAGQQEEALQLIGDTLKELLGDVVAVAERVDDETAATLLGGMDAVRAYATLLDARADVREELMDLPRAEADRARALRMHLHAVALSRARVDDETRGAIQRLAARSGREELAPKLQAVLDDVLR